VVVIVVAVGVKCARMCAGYFFEALGVVGGLVVDDLVVGGDVAVVHAAAVAVVVAPGITAEW
jgi:hypothetical protein